LARQFGTVVIEDLYVAGMLKNHRLARHISDASFGELRRQLEYKAVWNGGRVVVVDRWFCSSKTCSGCGAVKAKLARSERSYVCMACGLVLDRDLNAAKNLAARGEAMVAGSLYRRADISMAKPLAASRVRPHENLLGRGPQSRA
jgi:putative transposase